ncbi:UNVERIFIED_CONTAM: hypothetical protein RMT77_006391 [Armadillidium vulgare]
MMDELIRCEICTLEFNDFDVIPKVLHCGHSLCSPCIKKIFVNDRRCPVCRDVINVGERFLPKNYTLLKAVEINNSAAKCSKKKELLSSVKTMKRKCEDMIDTLSQKKSKIELHSSLLRFSLHELAESELENLDTGKAEKALRLAEGNLKDTDKVFSNFCKLKSSISVRLSNFENTENYLAEIYKRVENDENVFSAHQIDGEKKYGKVSVKEEKLIFNSLSLSKVPDNSLLILFDDLKECVGNNDFQTFIKISCNDKMLGRMVCFKMNDKHLSTQFIKLCTGECGPSYKSSSFHKDIQRGNSQDILVVESNFENINKFGGYNKFRRCEMNCKFNSNSNDMFLVVKSNGNFLINRTIKNSERNILHHSRVVYPTNLCNCLTSTNPSCMKILECGILFVL